MHPVGISWGVSYGPWQFICLWKWPTADNELRRVSVGEIWRWKRVYTTSWRLQQLQRQQNERKLENVCNEQCTATWAVTYFHRQLLGVSMPYADRTINIANCGITVCKNAGPVLGTKVCEILGEYRGASVVRKAICRLSVSYFIPNTFAIKLRNRWKPFKNKQLFAYNF